MVTERRGIWPPRLPLTRLPTYKEVDALAIPKSTPYLWPREYERLLKFVNKTDSCWLWTGGKTTLGYGHIRFRDQHYFAHRLMYRRLVGPIPSGLVIDHLCRTPSCVNPDHLEPVTQQVNVLRSSNMAAIHARQTHCKNGHEFTGDNLRITSTTGQRICRTCERAKSRRKRARARARREAAV